MYRPDGWRQPDGIGGETPPMAFEAGADAMLAGLRKSGYKASKALGNINFYSEIYDAITVIVIPDD